MTSVLKEIDGAVGILKLNRPNRMNAWTATLSRQLYDGLEVQNIHAWRAFLFVFPTTTCCIQEYDANPCVRVIVVTGAPCAKVVVGPRCLADR